MRLFVALMWMALCILPVGAQESLSSGQVVLTANVVDTGTHPAVKLAFKAADVEPDVVALSPSQWSHLRKLVADARSRMQAAQTTDEESVGTVAGIEVKASSVVSYPGARGVTWWTSPMTAATEHFHRPYIPSPLKNHAIELKLGQTRMALQDDDLPGLDRMILAVDQELRTGAASR